ncbi:MAG: helicase HerA domain-containing protein, partial [Bryobacteraceae bacterium]
MLPTPFAALKPTDAGWQASIGLRLVELQAERLPREAPLTARLQRLAEAYENSVRLAELIAGWSRPVSVELHMASLPSLDLQRAAGRVELAVRLTVQESEREAALARCLADYVALRTLLATFWEQAHFAPILNESDFQESFRPFTPNSAMCVGRRSAEIPLSEPFRWSSGALGFQAKPRPAPAGATIRHLFPWAIAADDRGALLETLLNFPAPQWVVTRLVTPAEREPHLEHLRATLRVCEQFLAGAHGDQLTLAAQADQIRQLCVRRLSRLAVHAVGVAVVLLAPGEADAVIARLLGQSISGDYVWGAEAGPFTGGFSIEDCDVKQAQDAFFVPAEEPYAADEAACAFRLPVVFGENELGLPVRRSQTARATLPVADDRKSGTLLAVNRHRGEELLVWVPLEHRFKHVFALGMTGTGKSTFMLKLLLQDLHQGHGVCLIDPHGD